MNQKRLSEDNPFAETNEDRILRALNNIYNTEFLIEKRLEEIANAVEANTANIEILEEAISKSTPIPLRKINLRYEHEKDKLWVNERFYIKFDGKQAYLLGLLFFPSSGKPRKSRVTFDDLVDDDKNYDHATGKRPTRSSFAQTANRINSKLSKQLHTSSLLTVTTKEMYFS